MTQRRLPLPARQSRRLLAARPPLLPAVQTVVHSVAHLAVHPAARSHYQRHSTLRSAPTYAQQQQQQRGYPLQQGYPQGGYQQGADYGHL